MTDPRRSLAQAAYEAHAGWGREQHPGYRRPWGDLSDQEREPYERMASAVAAQAVHDAGLEANELQAAVIRLRAVLAETRDSSDKEDGEP